MIPPDAVAAGRKGPGSPITEKRVDVVLEVPEAYRTGPFKTPRTLTMPPGLRISVFAAGIGEARFMAVGPDGTLFVSIPSDGKVLALPDKDGDGVADKKIVYAWGLNRPHGLAFLGPDLLVAETGGVVMLKDTNSDLKADMKGDITRDVPPDGGHWTRTVVVGPDGMLYVSAGSSCNACEEVDKRRASILRFEQKGGRAEVFATGLRNSVGLAFHPVTGDLWAVDNGRDMLGDDLPPEELNHIVKGGDYGWPYCFGKKVPDPEFGSKERCAGTRRPRVQMQAHSAPLGITFGYGLDFPKSYQRLLYVAFHGSWNRSVPTGYKVIAVPFNSKGVQYSVPVDFISGWLDREGKYWGRPVAPVVGGDGALYISDDYAEAVYRVEYVSGKKKGAGKKKEKPKSK